MKGGKVNAMTNRQPEKIDKAASRPSISAGIQLTKLSSVLNGLEHGASAMRAQVMYLMTAVKSGSYNVDPSQLSRRIIADCMGSNWRFSS
jgi:anti-sigma28 factor (negative regulator of flagellin synthesis)